LVEIGVSHHLARHVGRRARAIVAPIAIGAPVVESVRALRGADVGAGRVGAGHRQRLARKGLLHVTRERDFRLALAHGQRGRLPIRCDVDAIEAPGASA
jgi:hypothetical protein